jgi:hypothetical protein
MPGLSRLEIMRIVNQYIGVQGGYLGDFSYRSHADFYVEYCDVNANPYELGGTTRERFIEILSSSDPLDQAKIVRGVLARFPLEQPGAPTTRTAALAGELAAIATRLERVGVSTPSPSITSELVERALTDAETLIRTSGAASGIDRVHTALHGFMMAICDAQGIPYPADGSLTALFRVIRDAHPAFRAAGPRAQDVTTILRAFSSVLDAMNPVRNMASVAHPNRELLGEPEAMLVINAARTILHYLDGKLRAYEL